MSMPSSLLLIQSLDDRSIYSIFHGILDHDLWHNQEVTLQVVRAIPSQIDSILRAMASGNCNANNPDLFLQLLEIEGLSLEQIYSPIFSRIRDNEEVMLKAIDLRGFEAAKPYRSHS